MQMIRSRWRLRGAVLLAMVMALPPFLRPARADGRLHTAWTSARVLNAVTVADDGRVFVSFPYWGGGGTGPTVAEIDRNGQPHAFPDARWNHPDGTKGDLQPFVRVNAIRMGPDGLLWVVDSGDANVAARPARHPARPPACWRSILRRAAWCMPYRCRRAARPTATWMTSAFTAIRFS